MEKHPSIFTSQGLQKKFEMDGYVVINLFHNDEINHLKSIYKQLPKNNLIFESSSFLDDTDLLMSVNKEVEKVFEKTLNGILAPHKKLGTSFLTKQSSEYSAMPVHQDWTVVDETTYCSVTCWVPLQDTTILNGAMQVLPGSHLFSDALRSPSIPIAFEEIYDAIGPYLKTITLKAGEGIIFNQALWHASHPNHSNEDRLSVTYGFTQPNANLCMYYYDNGKVEKWQMPDDMFLHYSKIRTTPLIGQKLTTFEYDTPKITKAQLDEKAYKHRKQTKMKPLFKDKEHQTFFEENGYIVLPALETLEIEQLKTFYNTLGLKDEKGYGFHVGMDNENKELVTQMVNTIKSIALPKVQPYLVDTQLFTASYVIKEPNPQGVVPPHQDWSFVEDEENYCSVTCWIPLQDVNMENGCMGVIKGSHHFFDAFRASPSPQVGTPLKEHMFTIFPFLQLIEMKAGEALIFNNKTIHASPPNTTSAPRLAVGLGFTQKEAKICHYYLQPGTTNKVLKYAIDPAFFFKFDNAKLSRMFDEGTLIEGYGEPQVVNFEFENLTAEEFAKRMTDAGNTFNAPLVATMSKLFNYNSDSSKQEDNTLHDAPQNGNSGYTQNEPKLPFWKVYTPINIVREIKHRLTT